MATTFKVFYLGTVASIDPTEGNTVSEDAGTLVGTTFGGLGDPLLRHVHTLSPGSSGYSAGNPEAYDTNNFAANDTFRIDGGANQTTDGAVEYYATITYTDGSTATITAVLMQDTAGRLYLMPEIVEDPDQVALGAKPIWSLTLDSLSTSNGVLGANRFADSYAVCFTSGTLIRTPRGDLPVEALRAGDLVVTMDNGPQPIRWIGCRHLGADALAASPNLRPVLIPAGRLGNTRDLLVSPQHGLLVGRDHLVRAIHAARAPRSGIRVAHGKRAVTYFHLMFDAHQIVFAENAPSESFYPGPVAQTLLEPGARSELRRLFPQVFASAPTRGRIARTYGGTARSVLPRKLVVEGFSERIW